MKKFSLLLTTIFMSLSLLAQAPQGINYQTVIRDGAGDILPDTELTLQMTIRSGAPDGEVVYQETHDATTNAFGLVNLVIGSGAVQSGAFADINWGADAHYFETAVDLVGSKEFQVLGVTQFLSVPYALHAKTAGTTTGTSARYVGELYGGGVVFWVDHTGQHGLIVSMVDLSTSQQWSNVTNTLIGTTNDWDGAANTSAIIEQSGHTSSAAQLCTDYTNDDYGTGIFSDWYLPSVAELNHVWNNFYEVQKALTNDGNPATTPLVRTSYWSSSERYAYSAWFFYFGTGFLSNDLKLSTTYVRAVRAF
jgi:hypothetical protein